MNELLVRELATYLETTSKHYYDIAREDKDITDTVISDTYGRAFKLAAKWLRTAIQEG